MLSVVFCILLFVHGSTPICHEWRFVGFLDCRGLALKTIKGLWRTGGEWVMEIDFSHNRLVGLNITKLLLYFPNLQHIDVWDNPALDCRTVLDFGIDITSDCKFISYMLAFAQVGICCNL
jgi:hypothetical protein